MSDQGCSDPEPALPSGSSRALPADSWANLFPELQASAVGLCSRLWLLRTGMQVHNNDNIPDLHKWWNWVLTCSIHVLWMYPPPFQEIAEPLFHLKLAMEQLSASQTFRYILATVLAIGNFLNGCKVSIPELASILNVVLSTYVTFDVLQVPGFWAELPGEAVPGEGYTHPPAPALPCLSTPDAALPTILWLLLRRHLRNQSCQGVSYR